MKHKIALSLFACASLLVPFASRAAGTCSPDASDIRGNVWKDDAEVVSPFRRSKADISLQAHAACDGAASNSAKAIENYFLSHGSRADLKR